ncbi:DUF4124 domain-containing protein [Undibacterium jejuense]|uniref:DUF4124 domain-containing protein n=1 Tax=Undibacterium jejuense TaxID=1344949 RepID=A0A923HD38_9BURK|nr:DUF4124 domain-containing protein [Undibacterium jejuense]
MCLPLTLFLHNFAFADVYQCEQNGHIHYSQTACAANQKQLTHTTITADDTPSKETQQAAKNRYQREKSELKKLEQQRIKEQEKQEKTAAKQIAKSKQQKAACDKAQLQVKWAKEDAKSAAQKSEAKAKLKMQHVKEKAALSCQSN